MEVENPPCKFARIGNNNRAKSSPDEEKSDNNNDETIKKNSVVGEQSAVSSTTNCLNGWHQSRIIRVSRASGGKDRHSKVWTSKGLRDRRVRLSVQTAIQFYDLQDRLGYDQPSKAVEWLIKAAADAIAELPSLNAPSLFIPNTHDDKKQQQCSSTSDTSRGSSLSRSEKRVKARERARDRTAKDKEAEINTNNGNSFTTGIETNSNNGHNSQMGYAFGRNQPQFHMGNSALFSIDVSGEPHHPQMQQFSFIPDYIPVSASGGGLNFSALSSSSAGGFNGGTLQSNSTISSSSLSPLESTVPFFFGAASMENHQHQFPGGLQLYGEGSRHLDHKGKPKH